MTLRPLARAHRAVVWGFAAALPALNWAFFVVGLAGTIGTGAGLLPPYSHSWWAKITTVLLWLLFAREGFEEIASKDRLTR